MNSAYDIDAQILSDSVVGFKEWSAFYGRYLVTWAKIEVDFANASTVPMYVGMCFRPITNETTWSTWADWRNIEGNGMISRFVQLGAGGSSQDMKKLTIKAPLWKVHGNKKEYYGDTGFSAPVDLNPGRLIDGFVWIQTPTDLAATLNLNIFTKIKITLYVKLFQRKLLKQSVFGIDGGESLQEPGAVNTPAEYSRGDIEF